MLSIRLDARDLAKTTDADYGNSAAQIHFRLPDPLSILAAHACVY